jgi:glycosyltransferase involved in cell wall biosynthesis
VKAETVHPTPDRNMRQTVLYVANAAKIGGGNKVLIDLMLNLDPARFAPALVAPGRGQLVEWAEATGIPWAISPADDWWGIRGPARRAFELRRLIRRFRPAIVHAAAPMAYRALGIAALGTGAARVCHLGFPPEPGELKRGFLAGPDAVIGCYAGQADEHRAEIAAIRRRCIVVGVPNGVDIARFSPGDPNAEMRALRGDASLVVGILGHISDVKGYPAFVEAAADIARIHDGVEFWAIGAETTQQGGRAAIEKRAEELGIRGRVRFLGFRSDVHEVLKAVDVVTLPSLAEGFPLAVLEAMSAGKPVVATPVGGVTEAVTSGVTGLCVPPADPVALSQAIRHLIEHPSERQRLGEAARRRVVEHFSVAIFARRVQDLYGSLLDRWGQRSPARAR